MKKCACCSRQVFLPMQRALLLACGIAVMMILLLQPSVALAQTPADLVADRVFLRTGPNAGAEVTNPVAGQQYYVHFDWRNAGALAANGFRFEIRLNNGVIYSFNSASAPGNSTHNSYGPTPVVWPAGGGVINGALDVNDVITEVAENNNKAYRTYGFQSFGDFDFTAQVRSIENFNNNGGADLCFVYGYQDERHYYYVMFNRFLNDTRVYKVRDNDRILVGDLGTFVIPDNTYHTVRLLRSGGGLQVYWDGTLLGTASDTEFGAGGLGVGSFNDAGIFDDICVKAVGSTNCLFSDNFEDGNANGWLPLTLTRWDVITDGGDRGYRLHDTNHENQEYLRLGEYSLIALTGQADLVAQRIFLRNSAGAEVDVPTAGQALTVNFQWQNTGSAAANNVPVEIRRNGNVLCTANVTANPGEVKTTSCAAPVVFNPGNYFFECTVDVGNLIGESNENNNSISLTIVVPPGCVPTVCSGPALFPVLQGATTIGTPITGRNGSMICVDIRMQNNAQPIGAFGFQVQVNPAQLAFVSASAGDLTTGFTSINAIEAPAGSGNIICGGFGPNAIPAGRSGVLIRLCFTVTCTIGAMSDITLNNLIDDVIGMAACCNTFSCTTCLNDGDVNNSKTLSPGDALCAFNIYLNGGSIPAGCEEPNFACEVEASDVNCNGSVTPSDALAIFTRYLQGGLPLHCFARTTLAKSDGRPYRLALKESRVVSSNSAGEELLRLVLRVDNPQGLRAVGLQLAYPAAKVEPLTVQRTALTAKWVKLEGKVLWPGQLII
ncbi:MAG: CARDB domain-containing protein, partial [candidate division KSB1 bacterium]